MNPIWHMLNGVPIIPVVTITTATIETATVTTLNFGADVSLSRGAANRLDLATGDSLFIVSGGLGVGTAQTSAGALTTTGNISTGATGNIGGVNWWLAGTGLAGQVLLRDTTLANGVGFDVSIDAAIKIRTRAQSAFATLHGFLRDVRAEAAVSTDGNVTYSTANVLGGIITRSNMSSNRVDAFPTAADLVAAIPGCSVGTSFDVIINNDDTAQTVTVNGASNGITYQGAATAIATTECRLFRVLITNVTGAAEAATVFQVV